MRPPRGEKTRAEIAELVWRIIARAAYRGDKAPTMPDLAEELSVADSSVWNAVQMLCDSGLLERRKISRGGGGHCSAYRLPSGAETAGFATAAAVKPFVNAKRRPAGTFLAAAE